ncbi:MAG: hypothetical protein R2838_00935 [Caldilineaceae bacterium]
MNFSHGDYAFHARMAGLIARGLRPRRASRYRCWPTCKVQGPSGSGWTARSGRRRSPDPAGGHGGGPARTTETMEPDALILPVDFDLAPHVTAGSVVLIDDGNIEGSRWKRW